MPQLSAHTVFEIGLRSFPWGRLLTPAAFIVGGLLLFRFCRNKQIYQVTGIIVASLASIILLISLDIFVPNFVRLRRVYTSGKTSIVEGIVENFQPAPALGPARESFSVHGIPFSYNVLDDTPCFHNAPLRGGPIRAGMNVRIHYNDGCIQRVDVQR